MEAVETFDMPKYHFRCNHCEDITEVEGSMESPPQPEDIVCPGCGSTVYRDFLCDVPSVHFVGMDFYVNQERARKYARDGMDKDTANKFYNDSIRNSRDRMNEDPGHYKRMYMDPQAAIDQGLAKVNPDQEKAKKKAEAHKVTLQRDRKIKGKE